MPYFQNKPASKRHPMHTLTVVPSWHNRVRWHIVASFLYTVNNKYTSNKILTDKHVTRWRTNIWPGEKLPVWVDIQTANWVVLLTKYSGKEGVYISSDRAINLWKNCWTRCTKPRAVNTSRLLPRVSLKGVIFYTDVKYRIVNMVTCVLWRLLWIKTLQWRHNGLDGVSNHQPDQCLLIRLFRRRSKKTSKLRVTGPCVGNSPGTGEFSQMASNAENVSIWWCHHEDILLLVTAATSTIKYTYIHGIHI